MSEETKEKELVDGLVRDKDSGKWDNAKIEVGNMIAQPKREIRHEHAGRQLIKYKGFDDRTLSISDYFIGLAHAEQKTKPLQRRQYAQIREQCIVLGLNPMTDIAFWIDYRDNLAFHIKDSTFMRRANQSEGYRGFEAGWIISPGAGKGQKYICHGTDIPAGSHVVGAWCRVHVENRVQPIAEALTKDFARGADKTGSIWNTKANAMISKVARHQAHRLAFPDSLAGCYSETEGNAVRNAEMEQAPAEPETLQDDLVDAWQQTGKPASEPEPAPALPAGEDVVPKRDADDAVAPEPW